MISMQSRKQAGLLLLGGWTVLLSALAAAPAPSAVDRLTAQVVLNTLEHDDLNKPKLDDQVSRAWCRNYIKAMDSEGLYFEKADVDAFLAQDKTLVTRTREGDLSFAVEV